MTGKWVDIQRKLDLVGVSEEFELSGIYCIKRLHGFLETKKPNFRLKLILGDSGAVSRAGTKGATKVFKHRRKSPWVPTLTTGGPDVVCVTE